ncbi:hypothetical protein [Alteromonas facilis]|uniref:hypothetical protein n=1 Tax=Alteromonas facilis TaxID=2048004 RepID=UPI000C2886E5|nr:hypothetical protein [Alteromonas facilis]
MKQIIRLLPILGIIAFIALYLYAASLYPGGSSVSPNAMKWDWYQNLWCNLLSEEAINGLENPARPIALLAMALLSISIAIFYLLCADLIVKSKNWKISLRITGILLMLGAFFVFSKYHDLMTTIISICGLIGISGILRALYLNHMTFFAAIGGVCLFVICLNNFFYYNNTLHEYLPLVQHLNFILILSWTLGLNLKLLNK